MLQYRFDEQTNCIYMEAICDPVLSNTLSDLLPLTRPGFTVLVDLSSLPPSEIPSVILQGHQELCVHYGIRRCAYLCPDTHTLLELNKWLRKLRFKIERGYFTHLDDALHFLMEETVASL